MFCGDAKVPFRDNVIHQRASPPKQVFASGSRGLASRVGFPAGRKG